MSEIWWGHLLCLKVVWVVMGTKKGIAKVKISTSTRHSYKQFFFFLKQVFYTWITNICAYMYRGIIHKRLFTSSVSVYNNRIQRMTNIHISFHDKRNYTINRLVPTIWNKNHFLTCDHNWHHPDKHLFGKEPIHQNINSLVPVSVTIDRVIHKITNK